MAVTAQRAVMMQSSSARMVVVDKHSDTIIENESDHLELGL